MLKEKFTALAAAKTVQQYREQCKFSSDSDTMKKHATT